MRPVSVVIPYSAAPFFEKVLLSLTGSNLVKEVLVACTAPQELGLERCRCLATGPLLSSAAIGHILEEVGTPYLLLLPRARPVDLMPGALGHMIEKTESMRAALVYSDFHEESGRGKIDHPLNDYQRGSVRDDFDFGALMLLSVPALRKTVATYGLLPGTAVAGLYDLRLKLSITHPFHRVPEACYSVSPVHETSGDGKLFAYVDPFNSAVQKEMELVFTDYLKKIGAYIAPARLREAPPDERPYPVEASVIIPVRNRRGTIADAVASALSQQTDFPFNVIVVDNHSIDGTTDVMASLSSNRSALNHIVPLAGDLAIGGCWNEALRHPACGRYSVQLDSDDLYSTTGALQAIVDLIRHGSYGMVIGSYTLVNERLEPISPGLIDHREWSDDNGHNNALRINGLGAPRAFTTGLIAGIGFPNVSYGEDYAAALRVCREYRIGRIYESLYLCRRWSGNTDAALSLGQMNRNDAFKDGLRTSEIAARQKINDGGT